MINRLRSFIKRKIKRQLLGLLVPQKFYFEQKGVCPCCKKNVIFTSTNSWLRDSFTCSNCFCVPRERLLMEVLNRYAPGWHNMEVHESSPANRGVSTVLKRDCKRYTASYFYPDKPLGQMAGDYSCQNLEQLTFDNEMFSLFISQDVLEHVYHPDKAFREIERTLKKGGMHIFTTPLDNRHSPSVVWAAPDENGKHKWLYTPEYHANPIDEKGSPCTMHWGYDIVDYINNHTNMKSFIVGYDDLNKGIRGAGIEVIVSVKE